MISIESERSGDEESSCWEDGLAGFGDGLAGCGDGLAGV